MHDTRPEGPAGRRSVARGDAPGPLIETRERVG
jgi:hypothetical protein